MIKNLTYGTLAGGFTLFFWGAFSWMVLPWHNATLQSFKNETKVSQVLKQNARGHGLHIIPWSDHKSEKNHRRAMKRMQEGPLVFMNIVPRGVNPAMGPSLLKSLVFQCFFALIMTFLTFFLGKAKFWTKVAFLTEISFLAGLMAHLPNWVWWQFPFAWTGVNILDMTIGGFLAGFAIARVTPKLPKKVPKFMKVAG